MISMDLATVEVPATVDVGAEVELLGPAIPAEEWARHLDSINYEVTCGIGPRVPRRHVDEPGAAGPP
jgi:alanine racemase